MTSMNDIIIEKLKEYCRNPIESAKKEEFEFNEKVILEKYERLFGLNDSKSEHILVFQTRESYKKLPNELLWLDYTQNKIITNEQVLLDIMDDVNKGGTCHLLYKEDDFCRYNLSMNNMWIDKYLEKILNENDEPFDARNIIMDIPRLEYILKKMKLFSYVRYTHQEPEIVAILNCLKRLEKTECFMKNGVLEIQYQSFADSNPSLLLQ